MLSVCMGNDLYECCLHLIVSSYFKAKIKREKKGKYHLQNNDTIWGCHLLSGALTTFPFTCNEIIFLLSQGIELDVAPILKHPT